MSLEKYSSSFLAICDFCSHDMDTDEDEFLSAVNAMKRAGWRILKEGNEWMHKCDSCIESESLEDFDEE